MSNAEKIKGEKLSRFNAGEGSYCGRWQFSIQSTQHKQGQRQTKKTSSMLSNDKL